MSDLSRTYGCPACDNGNIAGPCGTCRDTGLVTRAQRNAFHDARRGPTLEQTTATLLASLSDADRKALVTQLQSQVPPASVAAEISAITACDTDEDLATIEAEARAHMLGAWLPRGPRHTIAALLAQIDRLRARS